MGNANKQRKKWRSGTAGLDKPADRFDSGGACLTLKLPSWPGSGPAANFFLKGAPTWKFEKKLMNYGSYSASGTALMQ